MSSQQLLSGKLDGEVCRTRTPPSTYARPRELRRLNAILGRGNKILQFGPDIKALPPAIYVMEALARTVNALDADFRWQHPPVPFEVYADANSLVVFEEFGAGAAALHLQDEVDRNRLLRTEEYRRWFCKDCDKRFGPGCGTAINAAPRSSPARRIGGGVVVRASGSGSLRRSSRRRVPRLGGGAWR
ncbi:hypothetical protein MSAS_06190 [Mycobacterium saskatchewanense]|uniref:Uncharacterized protein n=1 Tax=Mycobacterium saskatchewanense TaxID=220927 RepID=A0AAJ3TU64_9MYCO|nr:hypothetical protein AWC23_18060 [Mycobacterium saskatchewanense]BBX61445.1 hypothetical protein MSAS_06190 [Mycobacterium saskatchewanense]